MKQYDIAIIGGGFAGAATLSHLKQQFRDVSGSCILFEPRCDLGAGIAYDTKIGSHILNVPASRMSIDEAQSNSFLEWLQKKHSEYQAESFVPRRIYKEYLLDMGAIESPNLEYLLNQSQITAIRRDSDGLYTLSTEKNDEFTVRFVIFALGNSPLQLSDNATVSCAKNPWDQGALMAAQNHPSCAILGTGLSAVDAVLGLEERGYKGSYTLISRRGLMPQPYADNIKSDFDVDAFISNLLESRSLRSVLREFRKTYKSGVNWHILIDSMRPITQQLWSGFTVHQKRSFIRHLRPYWESHRHRVPRASHALIIKLQEEGRLCIMRGHIGEIHQKQEQIEIEISNKGLPNIVSFQSAFNCMGLWSNIRRCNSPLLQSLTQNQLAHYDELSMGLLTSERGELVDSMGEIIPGLFTLGSLRRGSLWESTAVREIRAQAKIIATEIVCSMKSLQ